MKIEWNGGKNPIKVGYSVVRVWFRSGHSCETDGDGQLMRWEHEGNGGDIIAYEVAGKPKASEETLRDRVAMAALTGLLAKHDYGIYADAAEEAFRFADAFMAARGDA
jgi:hypothetical protein